MFSKSRFKKSQESRYSQNVGEDAQGPHVGVEADGLVFGHLGGGELGRGRRHLGHLLRVQLGRQPEVNQLNVRAPLGLTHDVLRLREEKDEDW